MEPIIHISLACLVLVSCVGAHPGHNLHHGADHSHQPRQEGGGPFAGIDMLPTPGEITIASGTRTSLYTAQTLSSRPTGSITYIAVGTSSIGPIPVTIMPVPIATICSPVLHQSSAVSNTSLVSSPTLFNSATEQKLAAAATATLMLNATKMNETVATIPTFTAYDGLGCSTLYTQTSSAICSTVLSGLGSLPISVTDCQQCVTFSTSTGNGPVPTAAMTNGAIEQGQPRREGVAYFIAPWYDIANGQVPSSVLVQNCVQGMDGVACGRTTEAWSVVNQTTSIVVTRSVAFAGPVAGVSFSRVFMRVMLTCHAQPAIVTLAEGLSTINVPASTTAVLSIHTNITTSIPTIIPSRSRSVIGASIPPPGALSSSTAGPPTTTKTILIETVSHTTVTVFQTFTSTIKHEMTTEMHAATTGKAARKEV